MLIGKKKIAAFVGGLLLTGSVLTMGALASASPVSESLFAANAVPVTPAVTNDSAAVELGVQFTPKVAGTVTGVRFYKGAGNTGTHTAHLWQGTKSLATVTFVGETSSGWQTAVFNPPVLVKAGTKYTASYHDPKGHYADDQGSFSKALTSGDLTAPKNAGVFVYGTKSADPTGTWNASNYWVDVAFTPSGAVTPPPTTTQPPPTTTSPPVTTTTAPPVTTTSPPPSSTVTPPPATVAGFPTADGTGSSGTLTDVTPPTGELILGDDNQVLQNTRVHGTLTVLGCNVTVRNVEVDGGEPLASPVDNTDDLFLIWDKANEGCVTTFDHVTVNNVGQYATEGLRSNGSVTQHVTSLKIIGTQLGITLGEADHVSDSYILLGATEREDHNEDILDDGDEGVVLNHNTFLNPNDQTAALSLFNEFGPNSNFQITDNLLAGGGYTCYCGDGVDARASNVSFVGNVFSRMFYPNVGNFGPGRAYNPAGGGVWQNNVYANADGTITTEQVPQPGLDQ